MQTHISRTARLLVTVGIGLALTGCSVETEGPEGTQSRVDISAAQQTILEREQIGFDEHKEAWANYALCLENGTGYRATDPVPDPISGRRYNWNLEVVPGATFDIDAMLECQRSELSSVDAAYISQNPQQMDPVLLKRMFAGLDRAGISYTGNEVRYGDFLPNLHEDQARVRAIDEILGEAMGELFPHFAGWPADF
ncbi:hypothetical protein D9V32_11675 [Mycetocola tolaasinivorans]|uniref:Uncharacterized protein n=1 Tax=Mycetocola tolaasinivorans TaxID=76635 RepID=A0A3L7A6S4_9MICO|nr:hypothetical protein [Mycetocola tolaasinivorans]RLP75072.1 hypothetical protein D9V32_11675 [Mycetocola tolaasinivorans]